MFSEKVLEVLQVGTDENTEYSVKVDRDATIRRHVLRVTGTLVYVGAGAPVLGQDGMLSYLKDVQQVLTGGRTPKAYPDGRLMYHMDTIEKTVASVIKQPAPGGGTFIFQVYIDYDLDNLLKYATLFNSRREKSAELKIKVGAANDCYEDLDGGAASVTGVKIEVSSEDTIDAEYNASFLEKIEGKQEIEITTTKEYEFDIPMMGSTRRLFVMSLRDSAANGYYSRVNDLITTTEEKNITVVKNGTEYPIIANAETIRAKNVDEYHLAAAIDGIYVIDFDKTKDMSELPPADDFTSWKIKIKCTATAANEKLILLVQSIALPAVIK